MSDQIWVTEGCSSYQATLVSDTGTALRWYEPRCVEVSGVVIERSGGRIRVNRIVAHRQDGDLKLMVEEVTITQV